MIKELKKISYKGKKMKLEECPKQRISIMKYKLLKGTKQKLGSQKVQEI